MAEDQEGEPFQDGPREGEWLTISAAARRLSITPRAVRSRIDRGTLRWKPAGNSGRVVWIVAQGPSQGPARGEWGVEPEVEVELLREELAEVRVELARAEERAASADRRAEAEIAAERRAAGAEVAAKAALVEELRALLAELRRPWWRRLLG
jgi:hypothetical protein